MPALTMELLPVAAEAVMFSSHSSLTTSWQTWRGISRHSWIQLYKNRSSRKIDSQRLFTREEDFPKTFSLTENQFSGKTYLYTIHPCAVRPGHVEVGGVGEEPRDDALADRVHVSRRRGGNLVPPHGPQHLNRTV